MVRDLSAHGLRARAIYLGTCAALYNYLTRYTKLHLVVFFSYKDKEKKMISFKPLLAISQLVFLVFGLGISVRAAGELDTSFLSRVTVSGNGVPQEVVNLPGGKLLIAGRFSVINGTAVEGVFRLNADGSLDPNFSPPVFYSGSGSVTINHLAVQSTGKILVGGAFSHVSGELRDGFVRLNSNGSVDTSFWTPEPDGEIRELFDIFVYPDDRILLAGNLTLNVPGGGTRNNLVRLNADGSLDSTLDYAGPKVLALMLQSDGRIVLSWVNNVSNGVSRYNDNGSLDGTFATIDVGTGSVFALVQQSDGKILIGGAFTFVVDRTNLFRANSDGTIDGTFQNTGLGGGAVRRIKLLQDGRFYICGTFSRISGLSTSIRVYRIQSNGLRDESFSFYTATFSLSVPDIAVEVDKVAVLGGGTSNPVVRVNSNGSQDMTFVPPLSEFPGLGKTVLVLPDNKFLVSGSFARANGINRTGVARFNADGSLDTSFTAVGFFGQIFDLALQPDGKVIICGASEPRRLNTDGSLDVVLSLGSTNTVYDVEYVSDGRILTAGTTLRRYSSLGDFQTTLASVSGGGSFPNIYKMVVQADGKIVIVGNFTSVNGTARDRIARLNSDGTVDMTFNAGASSDISTIVLQSDGKILIGGGFQSVNGNPFKKLLVRLNSDGTIDSSFSATLDGPVLGIKVQTDGRIIFGGAFATVSGVLSPRIGRVNADGSRDTSFNVGSGANSTVWSIDMQSDGKIIYAGEFYRTNGISTLGVGRLLNAPPTKLFDYDGDGKSDVSVFRPSENKWYILRSSDSTVYQPVFAIAGDVPVPADYDGDQKTDVAIFRPSNAQWWYLSSANGSQVLNPFGATGDIPRPSDFDGDGKADFVMFRPSNNTWYRFGSTAGNVTPTEFGIAADKPVTGDFDGDGKTDLAVFRPSTGDWWYAASSAGGAFRQTHWGQNGDLPVPADYDGDAKTDLAVFRPSDGGWYILNSSNGSFTTTAFGTSEDRPVAADYDGDGRADIAVFRPSSGLWYLLRSTSGFAGLQFGISTDSPTPSAYVQ